MRVLRQTTLQAIVARSALQRRWFLLGLVGQAEKRGMRVREEGTVWAGDQGSLRECRERAVS